MKTWCAFLVMFIAVTDLALAERHYNHHHHHHSSRRQKEDGPLSCGTPGCPSVCRIQYGPQADGFCQTSEEQYCVCIHTNRQKPVGGCGSMYGCSGVCKSQYGPQADGTCQQNEDQDRCICLHTKE